MKTIQARLIAIATSKTSEELKTNQELFELQLQLDHQTWLREQAEKQVKFYQDLNEINDRLDAAISRLKKPLQ